MAVPACKKILNETCKDILNDSLVENGYGDGTVMITGMVTVRITVMNIVMIAVMITVMITIAEFVVSSCNDY